MPYGDSWLIKHVLEVEIGQRLVQRMVIPLVSGYQRTETPATARDWTLGARPVKQKMGYREARISLSGNAGNARREGYRHTGETVFLMGEQLFAEFDLFIRAYELEGQSTEGPITRSNKARPSLIYRNMEYGTADYVEIDRYAVNRNDGNARMMTSYSLDLITEGPVVRRPRITFGKVEQQDKHAAELARQLKTSEQLEKEQQLEQYGTPDKPLPKIVPMPAGITQSSLATIEDQLPVRWAQFRGPIVQARQAMKSVRSAADAVRMQLALPRVVVADLFDTVAEAVETLEAMHDAIPGAANREDARQWFYEAYAAIESTRVQALTNLGATGQRLPSRSTRRAGTGIMPSPASTSSVRAQAGVLVTTAQLEAGDTLPQFAARELGDPELWQQIMDLNDMASPYEAANGVPLYGGLVLNVPFQGGLPEAGAGNDLFGTDLRFQDGDLVLNGTTDFSLISGPPNYQQRISRRLSAVKGENGPFPEWGMPKLVGEPGLAGTAGYIASHVREQCEADPATKRVDNLALQPSGGTYEASFSLIPVVGPVVPVVTSIPS